MPNCILGTDETTMNKEDKNSSLCGIYSLVRRDM